MKRLLAKREEKKLNLQEIVPSSDGEGQQQKQVWRPLGTNEVGHVSMSCIIVSLILACSLTINRSPRHVLDKLNRRWLLLLFRHCVLLSHVHVEGSKDEGSTLATSFFHYASWIIKE